MQKAYKFHVNSMHCNACVVLTERELSEVSEISGVKASLKDFSVEVTGDFGDKKPEQIVEDLSVILKPHGYTLSLEKQNHLAKWSDFNIAVPLALAFVVFFIVLQKLGIVNLINASEVSYGTAFIIGLVASVSTCMAVVGGLVLSMSANFAKEGDPSIPLRTGNMRPQILFHVGRLVSFFILGGVIGAFGSTFQLGITSTFILSFIVAIVLLILGINLLDVFPWAKKLQPTIPNFIGKRIHGLKNLNHTFTPILIGITTFFLPCGFTQSMQIYTLTTGSFLTGSLIMFSFALGTLPVLSLLSFSSLGIHKKAQSGIFFKTAGLIVIFFGIFNLINALVAIGIIPPIFNF
jgi:sulfite exporter TauE/SafE/copper chaperone CopZ